MRNSLGQRKFLSMLAASSLEMALLVVTFLADTIIAGQFLGEYGVSAANIISPLVSITGFIGGMISLGVSFMFGDAVGKTDQTRADELFGMSVILSAVSGLAIFAVISIFRDEYFAFINPSPEVLAYAQEYYSYFRFVMMIDPLAMLLSVMVYNDGDELISNIAHLINIFGNIVLSVIFAFPLKMGLSGIALGTLIGNIISIAILLCHFLRKTNSLHMRIRFSFSDVCECLTLGFVDSGMYLMIGLLLFVMNKVIVSQFGSEYLPVLSMAVNILDVAIIFDGVASAMLPIVSVYYSEGNYPAVRKVMTLAVKVSVIEGLAFSGVLYVFAEYVPVFFGIVEPEIVRACVSAVRITSTTLVVSALMYLFETYYMIQGKTVFAVISACMRNLVFVLMVSIPFALMGSISGVWAGFACAQVLTMILCCGVMFAKYGREFFPLYLEERYPIADYDLMLSPEAVISVRDSAAEFLASHGIPTSTKNQAMLLIEETGMLILERNKGRKVLAEYTVELRKNHRVQITIRDDGEIFDVTDEDLNITSLRSYIVSQLMSAQKNRKNLITTSFNRNVFDVKGGIVRRLIMR